MKKNGFKAKSNSKAKINNKKMSNKNANTSKVSFKNNKSNLSNKSNKHNLNRSKSLNKTKTNTNIKMDKKNRLLKEKKKNKKEKIIKTEKKNEEKKEKEKEIEIKNKNDLSLNKKDLDLLLTNFNKKKNISPKFNQNISLNTSDFNDKIILKHLSNKKNELQIELSKINKQNTYLKEISLNNLNNLNFLKKDNQIRLIKNLKQSQENLLEKVSSINQQIYQININHKNNSKINDNTKEEYSEELRKEFIFNNMKKWNKPRSSFKRRIKNLYYLKADIKNNSKISQNEQENKTKDKSIGTEKLLSKQKHKSFINNIIHKNINQGYLYQKMANSFDEKEKIYITESIKPKNKEIRKFNKLDANYSSIKRKISNLEKIDKLHKLWKERNELLPKYISPLYKDIINTEKNEKKEEKVKIEKKRLLYELKKNYGKEKVNLPKISFILKKEWDKKEIKFNLDKYKRQNNIINNNLNIKLIQLKNKNKSFSKNEEQKNNSLSEINRNEKFYNSFSRNKQQNKNYHSFIDINNKLTLNNNIININNKSSHKSSKDINNIEEIKKKKFTTNKINRKKDIDDIKFKIKIMEDKYKRGKELLKLKGGYINNEDFGDEMNKSLINSTKGKSDVIEMEKLDKNNE